MPLMRADEAYATKWEVLVYGEPGIGKTTLFSQMPATLFIEVDDNGHIVLQDSPIADQLHVFYTKSWPELTSFIKMLPKSELIKSVDNIVFDTLSEAQTMERLRQVGDVLDEKWKFNENIYAKNNFQILALIRELRKCGKNIVWICHETTELVGATQDKRVVPNLSDKLLQGVQSGVDGTFYYKRVGANRTLQTDGMGEVQTKSRFPKARPLVNPTWDDLKPLVTSRMKHD